MGRQMEDNARRGWTAYVEDPGLLLQEDAEEAKP
jgi:hypothetical protein